MLNCLFMKKEEIHLADWQRILVGNTPWEFFRRQQCTLAGPGPGYIARGDYCGRDYRGAKSNCQAGHERYCL